MNESASAASWMQKSAATAYWIGLLLWIAALIAAAVAAMNVFTTLPQMRVEVARFEASPSDLHGRLLAGVIMERVFFTVDLIQFVAVPVTVIVLGIQIMGMRMRLLRPANLVRTICILAAAIMFTYHATNLAPRMNRELRESWTAAEAGDLDELNTRRAQFQSDHRAADAILKANLILLLIGAGASACAFIPGTQQPKGRINGLEKPQLLGRTR